ncbi:nitrate/sulfonate/bicarbonate ABC transporter periplasmic component-like protein [Mycobacterium tuberculosis]|nr:nitrate/sulfonate/bicarbonate ABC transporter periplasmic component-like protein [Mycobacterium tuberculosis]
MVAALTSCGGDAGADGGPTKMTVGLIPVADYAPVAYALEQGYFEAEGLDIEIQPLQGGAAAVPGLLSGDLQVSVTNWVSFVQAVTKKTPIRAFASGAVATSGYSGVYVRKGADITDAAGLRGKVVAVTELKTISELTTRDAIKRAGVDPASVQFTTVPLNSIVPAVSEGQVDGGWLVEPFLSQGKAAGQRQVLDAYAGRFRDVPIGGYITSANFAAKNQEALKGFAAALGKAVNEMNDDKSLVEDTLIGMKAMKPEQKGSSLMPTFGDRLSPEDVQVWADAMIEHGFIDASVDLGEAIIDVG